MSVLFTRRGTPPSTGKKVSDYAVGDIVLIHENGSPVEFYVAKHDYESSLNGAGRTLLVRKDAYKQTAWNSSGKNAYASSTIDTLLTGTYKALLSSAVQSLIGETTIYYTTGNGNTSITTLKRSVFLLSVNELGLSVSGSNSEGTTLPIASTLKVANMNGSAVAQWTRTPMTNSTTAAVAVNKSGSATSQSVTGVTGTGGTLTARPCFTIPSNTKFDPDTNTIL